MNRLVAVTLLATAIVSPAEAASDSSRGIVRPPYLTTDSVRVAEALRRASAFAAVGRMSDARREYRSVISKEAADGGYPAAPLWLLANAYYADDNFGDAARTLEKLADAAREAVDPSTELTARLESTILWARLKEIERARTGLYRLRVLLKSPAIPDTVRSWARSRIGE
jgi:hypothetical protein